MSNVIKGRTLKELIATLQEYAQKFPDTLDQEVQIHLLRSKMPKFNWEFPLRSVGLWGSSSKQWIQLTAFAREECHCKTDQAKRAR